MSTTLRNTTILVIVVALAAALITALAMTNQRAYAAPFVGSAVLGAATTSSAVSVTTSTRILATTTSVTDPTNSHFREYASICNPSATKQVVISLNNDKPVNATTGGGIWINANSCYEITDRNLYQGSITASTSDQSAVSVLVVEYVQ